MRKTQYTPGKWSIAYDIPGSIIDAEGDTVARVVQYTSNPYEVKAHAHLIAAAPELLEALEWSIGVIKAELESNPMWPGNLPDSMALQRLMRAHATIAKARGLQ